MLVGNMQIHHALLCIGTHKECLSQIPVLYRTGVDAEVIEQEQLDIGEARALTERAASRPIVALKRCFVISCRQITLEAQNALLKLFEDPPATAQFYIIVPRPSVLLPTLRSRLHLLYETDTSKDIPDEETVSFLRASFSERLLQIAKLAKEKDNKAMRVLVSGIEHVLAGRVRKEESMSYLQDVLLVSSYSEIRGASHKMLLEHVALSIPQNLI